jgi:hypothetical protein
MSNEEQVVAELQAFVESKNLPKAVFELLKTMVFHNVSGEGAKQFCAEHFMAEAVADHYEDFINHLIAMKEADKQEDEVPTDLIDTINDKINQIYQSLEEIKACLAQIK